MHPTFFGYFLYAYIAFLGKDILMAGLRAIIVCVTQGQEIYYYICVHYKQEKNRNTENRWVSTVHFGRFSVN